MKTVCLAILSCFTFLIFSCSKTDEKRNLISITSVSPIKAKPTQRVEVKGIGFRHLADSGGVIHMNFGNVAGEAYVLTDSLIIFYVPLNAQTGPLCIDDNNKRYCSDTTFTVLGGNYRENTFSRLPDYPGSYNRPGSMFSIGDDVYVGFDEFWRFSTQTYSWTKVASMPYYSVRTAAFAINGKGYIFGGLTAMGDGTERIWEYDPGADKWNEKTPIPAGKRFGSICFVYKNKAYIAGGEPAYNMPSTRQELWEYDPALDKWTRKADLPVGTELEKNAFRLRNKFYVPSGGYGTQEYDPETNTWRVLQSGSDTQYKAILSSSRWQNVVYFADALPFEQVYRFMMNDDGETFYTQLIHSPSSASGQKLIDLYTSIGEELFMIHVDSNNRLVEFWEYLPPQ